VRDLDAAPADLTGRVTTLRLDVTQKLLPPLRRRRRPGGAGRLGRRRATMPFGGPYHATKFALEAIAESLRLELRPQGVGVAIVEPGTISAPIWSKAVRQVEAMRGRLDEEGKALYDSRLAKFQDRFRSADEGGDDPEEVAGRILAALDGGGARYPVGRGVGTISKLRPLIPDGLFDRVVGTKVG
jgi:NAD(P)-dependent dehydrogenase (short-subunit alcohol dehydrogenase family)